MINKIKYIKDTTDGMPKEDIQALLDTGVGVLITNTRCLKHETRFVFAVTGRYRIKLLTEDVKSHESYIKRVLTDKHYAMYEGSLLDTYYRRLSFPESYEKIQVVGPDGLCISKLNQLNNLSLPSMSGKGTKYD